MFSFIKNILLFPLRLLSLLAAAGFLWFGCRSKKDDDPTYGFVKKDGSVSYRTAFLGLLTTKETPIVEADAASFDILNRHYAKDRRYAYYHQYFFEADVATFEALSDDYARDKNHAYYDGAVLPDANPATLALLPGEGLLASDGKNVFLRDERISRDAAHIEKLGALPGNYKSTDFVLIAFNRVEKADPLTFELIDTAVSTCHFRDQRRVYFNGMALPKADPKTFVPLNAAFGKDKHQVFMYDLLLAEADYASFEVIDGEHAKDKNRTYYTGDAEGIREVDEEQ